MCATGLGPATSGSWHRPVFHASCLAATATTQRDSYDRAPALVQTVTCSSKSTVAAWAANPPVPPPLHHRHSAVTAFFSTVIPPLLHRHSTVADHPHAQVDRLLLVMVRDFDAAPLLLVQAQEAAGGRGRRDPGRRGRFLLHYPLGPVRRTGGGEARPGATEGGGGGESSGGGKIRE